jgi:hypothetical protein
MADWTSIPDATFDPDRPVLGSTHLAIVKNFEALAEGATGAPKILTPAINNGAVTNEKLVAPTAGDNIIFRLQEASIQIPLLNAAYPDTGLNNRFSSQQHVGCTVLISGTIRCFMQRRVYSGGGTINTRIVKNGAVVSDVQMSGSTFTTHQVDVSVNVGDIIIFQMTAASVNAEWRQLRVLSGTITPAVA